MGFLKNGAVLAAAGRSRVVHRWELKSRKELPALGPAPDYIDMIACAPDGRVAATGVASLRLWRPGRGRALLLRAHSDWLYCVAFSPDGRRLATGSDDGTARVYGLGRA